MLKQFFAKTIIVIEKNHNLNSFSFFIDQKTDTETGTQEQLFDILLNHKHN